MTNDQGLIINKNDDVQVTIGNDIYNGTVKKATWDTQAGWHVNMTVKNSPAINTVYIGMNTEWIQASQGGQITKI